MAWKHDLDDEVHRLNAAAKVHNVTVPSNYYFGFSRYLNQSPGDEQTAVLSKQLMGIEQISTILINASVKNISVIRRSYEEDPHSAGGGGGSATDTDRFNGLAVTAPASAYIAYPFEFDFETTSENLRPIINGLIQSPYLFVVRSITVQSSELVRP